MMPASIPRECRCGSGEPRYALIDASGVFCTYVCGKCEESKRKGYDPRIFTQAYNPDKPDTDFPEE